MKTMTFFYLFLFCLITACSSSETTESTESEMVEEPTETVDLQAVLTHHLESFMANDLAVVSIGSLSSSDLVFV